jgi:hypothetical protein
MLGYAALRLSYRLPSSLALHQGAWPLSDDGEAFALHTGHLPSWGLAPPPLPLPLPAVVVTPASARTSSAAAMVARSSSSRILFSSSLGSGGRIRCSGSAPLCMYSRTTSQVKTGIQGSNMGRRPAGLARLP